MIKEPDIRNKKITKYPFGTLYEYDNGLKIIYYKNANALKTDIEYFFSGGSSFQKFNGLAHFTEHSMFFSRVLRKSYARAIGATSPYRTKYILSINHENFQEVNGPLKKLNMENQLLESICNNISLFFNEVDGQGWKDSKSPQFTENYFEEEKNIIDEEFRGKYEDTQNKIVTDFYRRNFFSIRNAGNADTLKLATLDDVIEFKKNNYVLENFIYRIITPLSYDKIEERLVKELSARINSNPKGKVNLNELLLKKVIDFERYNIVFENKTNKEKVEVLTNLALIPQKETFVKDFVSFYLVKEILGKNTDFYEKIRRDRKLVYFHQLNYDFDDNMFLIDVLQSVKKKNLGKLLVSDMAYVKDKLVVLDIEEFYRIKVLLESELRNVKNDISKDIIKNNDNFFEYFNFTNETLENIQKYVKNLSYEEAQQLIRDYLSRVNLNVAIKGNVSLKDLPSFEMLKDIMCGKQVDVSNYPKDMSEDINKYKYVFDLTKNPNKCQALTVVSNNDCEIEK